MFFNLITIASLIHSADTIVDATLKIVELDRLKPFMGISADEAMNCVNIGISKCFPRNENQYLTRQQSGFLGKQWLNEYSFYVKETGDHSKNQLIIRTLKRLETTTGLNLFEATPSILEKRTLHKTILAGRALLGLGSLGLIVAGVLGLLGVFGELHGTSHGTYSLAIASGVLQLVSVLVGFASNWEKHNAALPRNDIEAPVQRK